MSPTRRILMIRHGETDGESSIRYHGRGDVPLAERGREQMRRVAKQLPIDRFGLVVASPLARSWEAAEIVTPGTPVTLVPDFAEIDFGRWEGLTFEEIEKRDPVMARQWQEDPAGFGFPEGERRADFRARVQRGLDRVLAVGAESVLLVGHKGVIRTIVLLLCEQELEPTRPELGEMVQVSRRNDGRWHLGRRSSSPGLSHRVAP